MSGTGVTVGSESEVAVEPRIDDDDARAVVARGSGGPGGGHGGEGLVSVVQGAGPNEREERRAGTIQTQTGTDSGQGSYRQATSSGPTRSTEAHVWEREGGECWLCGRAAEGTLMVAHQMPSAGQSRVRRLPF